MTKVIILTALATTYIIVALMLCLQSATFYKKGYLWRDLVAAILWPISYLILYPIIWLQEKLKLRQVYNMVRILVFNRKAKCGSEGLNYNWLYWKEKTGLWAKLKRKMILKLAEQNNITIREKLYQDDDK